VSLLQNFSVQ